jgi:hypothetical protein
MDVSGKGWERMSTGAKRLDFARGCISNQLLNFSYHAWLGTVNNFMLILTPALSAKFKRHLSDLNRKWGRSKAPVLGIISLVRQKQSFFVSSVFSVPLWFANYFSPLRPPVFREQGPGLFRIELYSEQLSGACQHGISFRGEVRARRQQRFVRCDAGFFQTLAVSHD